MIGFEDFVSSLICVAQVPRPPRRDGPRDTWPSRVWRFRYNSNDRFISIALHLFIFIFAEVVFRHLYIQVTRSPADVTQPWDIRLLWLSTATSGADWTVWFARTTVDPSPPLALSPQPRQSPTSDPNPWAAAPVRISSQDQPFLYPFGDYFGT